MTTSSYAAPPPLYLQPSSASNSLYSVSNLETVNPTESLMTSSLQPSVIDVHPTRHSASPEDVAFHQHAQYTVPETISLLSGMQPNSSQHSPTSGTSAAGSATGSQNFTPPAAEDLDMMALNGEQVDAEDDISSAFYDPLRVKHRRRTSPQQLKILEHHFEVNPKPDVNVRRSLSEQLSMTPREVQVWFQNRRAKIKKLREKAEQEGTDPGVDAMSRLASDGTSPVETYWAHGEGPAIGYAHGQHEEGLYYPPHVEVHAPHETDYRQQRYVMETRSHQGTFIVNGNAAQSSPDSYFDPTTMTTSIGTMYAPANAPTNMYGQPIPYTGYPTPTSLRTPSHSPHDPLPAGLADGITESGYVASGTQTQRFSLPVYAGPGTHGGYSTGPDGISHPHAPYATPPFDASLGNSYREFEYLNRQEEDEIDLADDQTDTYSFTSHQQPSMSSFHLPLDAQGTGSRLTDRRGSLQALDQAFDAGLNFASSAAATTSPTRIGGIAAPQWPGASSRNSYAAPAFAPTSTAPPQPNEYVYGTWPQTTPAVNYFPTVDRAPVGRRGSLHSIPEQGGLSEKHFQAAQVVTATDPSWLGAPGNAALSERRGSNASLARKARSNSSLRTPYSTQDARNRSPTSPPVAPASGVVRVDARVVPDGLQYALPTSTLIE